MQPYSTQTLLKLLQNQRALRLSIQHRNISSNRQTIGQPLHCAMFCREHHVALVEVQKEKARLDQE